MGIKGLCSKEDKPRVSKTQDRLLRKRKSVRSTRLMLLVADWVEDGIGDLFGLLSVVTKTRKLPANSDRWSGLWMKCQIGRAHV